MELTVNKLRAISAMAKGIDKTISATLDHELDQEYADKTISVALTGQSESMLDGDNTEFLASRFDNASAIRAICVLRTIPKEYWPVGPLVSDAVI